MGKRKWILWIRGQYLLLYRQAFSRKTCIKEQCINVCIRIRILIHTVISLVSLCLTLVHRRTKMMSVLCWRCNLQKRVTFSPYFLSLLSCFSACTFPLSDLLIISLSFYALCPSLSLCVCIHNFTLLKYCVTY